MSIESIQCVKCGSPLEVESTARFAICTYCGSRLRITRGASGHPLGVLEDIKLDTEIIAKQTAINHLRERLQHFRAERDRLEVQLQGELERAWPRGLGRDFPYRWEKPMAVACVFAIIGVVIWMSSSKFWGGVCLAVATAEVFALGRALRLYRRYERAESRIREKYGPFIASAGEQIQSTQRRIAELQTDMDRLAREL